MRQLRDREDVDQVEEQLDRRDRLLEAVARAGAGGVPVVGRAITASGGAGTASSDARGGGRGRGARASVGTAMAATTAATSAETAMTGTATMTARISRGGQTSSPRKMTTPTSATRRPPPVTSVSSALTSTVVGCPVCGGRTSVVFMTATLPERAAHVVRVGAQSHPQSARPVGHGARWSRSRRARWPAARWPKRHANAQDRRGVSRVAPLSGLRWCQAGRGPEARPGHPSRKDRA